MNAVRERERGGDHAKAQNRYIGSLVAFVGDSDVAGPQPSIGDCIGDEVGAPETHRADELAHLYIY